MVALRKESVDRNLFRLVHMLECSVALRKESVDRNLDFLQCLVGRGWSLSARRAWIEMTGGRSTCAAALVALRKESVDRNGERLNNPVKVEVSLSARRAWIEICSCCYLRPKSSVALRKESVDRNLDDRVALVPHQRRSPQGERG